jgi:hypothetical protein
VWAEGASLRYRWVDGPLPFVEGRLEFVPGAGGCEIRHVGTYDREPTLRGRIVAAMVRVGFRRAMRRRLRDALGGLRPLPAVNVLTAWRPPTAPRRQRVDA